MANLHLAVATPNYKTLEHFNDFADPWVHDLLDRSPRVGMATGTPDVAGAGVGRAAADGWEPTYGVGVGVHFGSIGVRAAVIFSAAPGFIPFGVIGLSR